MRTSRFTEEDRRDSSGACRGREDRRAGLTARDLGKTFYMWRRKYGGLKVDEPKRRAWLVRPAVLPNSGPVEIV